MDPEKDRSISEPGFTFLRQIIKPVLPDVTATTTDYLDIEDDYLGILVAQDGFSYSCSSEFLIIRRCENIWERVALAN